MILFKISIYLTCIYKFLKVPESFVKMFRLFVSVSINNTKGVEETIGVTVFNKYYLKLLFVIKFINVIIMLNVINL